MDESRIYADGSGDRLVVEQRAAGRDKEIYFHTPGERADAYPYQVVAGGRAGVRRGAPEIRRRFNQHVLILTQHGTGQIGLRGRTFTCEEGSLVWLDTSREYSHDCAPSPVEWQYFWLGVRGFGLDSVIEFVGANRSPVLIIQHSAGLLACFREVLDRLRRPPASLDASNSASVADILATIDRDKTAREYGNGLPTRSIGALLRQMRADLARPWNIAEIGGVLGVSGSQVHRRFLSTVGSTPMEWLRRERMTVAKHLLVHSDALIGAIAARCGYGDPFHFSRDFRRTTGSSPTEFRHAQGR